MIARVWRGRVQAAQADAYYDYLLQTGLKEYTAVPGNRGVEVLRRTEGDVTEYLLLSYWESLEAIKQFAGDDFERAVYYPEDDHYLLEKTPNVEHYELHATFGVDNSIE